jgi:hypothetical protein
MRIVAVVLFITGVAFAVAACRGQDAVPKDPAQQHSYWMKMKLEWSQSILADLAMANWEKMGDDARKMHTLSKIEGRFRRTDQEEYRAQLAVFDQANNELSSAVEKENIDAATLAYMHLIHSCVNCHKILRTPASTPK